MAMSSTLAIALMLSAKTDKAAAQIEKFTSKTANQLAKLASRSEDYIRKGFTDLEIGKAIARPVIGVAEAAAKFEKGMIAVRKQMQQDTPEAVKAMTKDIFDMSLKLGMAADQTTALVAGGLKMGVPEKAIASFTLTAGKMVNAFDLPAEQISEQMAGIANMFKIPINQIGELGDAINYLDDNTLASGGNLIELMQRIGGISKYLRANQAAALSSTMLSLGETPERAATAINGMINTLAAAGVQSKRSRMVMKALGFDPATLQREMVTNAQGVIEKVLKRIQTLKPDKQQSALSLMFGKEYAPALNKLINGMSEYGRQQKMLNGAQKGSMDKEHARYLGSTAAQLQNAQTNATELAINIGNGLLPSINALVKSISPVVQKFSDWAAKNPNTVRSIAKVVLAIAGLKIVSGSLKIVFGSIISPVSKVVSFFAKGKDGVSQFSKALGFLGKVKNGLGNMLFKARFFGEVYVRKAITAVSSFARILGGRLVKAISFVGRTMLSLGRLMLANPILLAVAAIAVVIFLVIKNWSKIKPWLTKLWVWVTNATKRTWNAIKSFFSGLWSSVKQIFTTALELIASLFLNFTPIGLVFKHWKPLTEFFSNLWEKVKSGFMKFINWFVEKWKWLNDHIIKPIGNLFSGDEGDIKVTHGYNQPRLQPVPVARGGNNSITFNPVIQIQGNADMNVARAISAQVRRDFDKKMQDYEHNKQRRAIG